VHAGLDPIIPINSNSVPLDVFFLGTVICTKGSSVLISLRVVSISPMMSSLSLPSSTLGDLDTRNWCFNLNISDKDLADLAYSGLTPHLKDKLESHVFSNVSQVL
jgi:hypothetical protein